MVVNKINVFLIHVCKDIVFDKPEWTIKNVNCGKWGESGGGHAGGSGNSSGDGGHNELCVSMGVGTTVLLWIKPQVLRNLLSLGFGSLYVQYCAVLTSGV